MQFNGIDGPVISAAAGLGIVRSPDIMVAEYISRGELKVILGDFAVPGPQMSLVYPSAGHQSAKVRVFSDFAADLLRSYTDGVQGWLKGTKPDLHPLRLR
jgi:DNA-binding transcriptional LysR family regulator